MSLDIYLDCECCGDRRNFNLTHNLAPMAREAGLFWLWRLDDPCPAGWLVPALEAPLENLKARPEHYKALNPPNGWGSYEGLVEVLEDLLNNCRGTPGAQVSTWR